MFSIIQQLPLLIIAAESRSHGAIHWLGIAIVILFLLFLCYITPSKRKDGPEGRRRKEKK